MDSPSALVPGPIARTLLELAERRASGEIAIGGRKLVLHEGQVTGVLPAPGDEPLDTFLVKAGRLDEAGARQARSKSEISGKPLIQELELILTPTQLTQGLRALWLDRLVFGLQVDVDAGQGLNDFEPSPTLSARAGEHRTPLLELLLDALARRAGERDAGLVGSQAGKLLIWQEGSHRAAAEAWAELPVLDPPRVARLLATSPAAASRIAALLRAGLVYLSARVDSPPPPPPRPTTIAPPPAAPIVAVPAPGSVVQVIPQPRDGAGRPSEFGIKLPPLPPILMRLDDPLDPLEKRIANLEASSAPARERATAWLEFGRAWQRHHRSLEEACRAFREAAAADPTFYDALDAAATLCTAMGRVELGNAYARAAAAAAASPAERARSLKLIARNAQRFGAVDESEATLVEALAADPTDGDAFEALARVRVRRGDLSGAAEAAEAGAGAVRRPERACALLGFARSLADSPARTSAYARALHEGGFGEAALSELRRAAAGAEEPDVRRAFLLEAAELAELAEHPDLSYAFLLDAFVAEPQVEVLHEPLAEDARAAGADGPLAVVLEAIGAATSGATRARWFMESSDAFARSGEDTGRDSWAAELLTRALIADPGSPDVSSALEAEAARSAHPTLLLDALERAGRPSPERTDDDASRAARVALLQRAAALAEESGQPARALSCLGWARELAGSGTQPSEPTGDEAAQETRLASLAAARADLFGMARSDLDQASPDQRAALSLRLGQLLRDVPTHRDEAIACLTAALAGAPEHRASAFASLARLHRLEGRDADLIELWLEAPSHLGAEAAAEALGQAAGALALAQDPLGSAGAALRVLELAPTSRIACARLDLAARQVADPELQLQALRARLRQHPEPQEAARLHGQVALVADAAGSPDEAIAAARAALTLDPRCADALSLLVRYFDALPDSEALEWVAPARAALGDTPALLETCLSLAERAGDEELTRTLLDAHFRILPTPAVALERVRRAIRASERDPERDADALLERADQALLPLCVAPETASVVSDALSTLRRLSRENAACTLALRALDTLGERELLKQSWELAKSGVDQASKIATLERIVAWTEASARVDPLRRLAAIQRELGNAAAEARTLLRVLAEEPHDPPALERLAELYTETGETQRLMAVLALSLEAAAGVLPRRQRLLCLAQAAMQRANDPERAAGFVEQAVEESGFTDVRAQRAREEWLALVAEAPAHAEPAATASREPRASGAQAGPFDAQAWEAAAREAAGDDVEELARRFAATVRALEDEGELQQALDLATRGLQLDPPHPELLVTFERLTLASDSVDRAKAMYEDLCARAMGPHGLRGLRYRQARWLESAGANREALDAYALAFAMAPGEGVVFNAIERLSVLVSDSHAMVDALSALAERATLADRRVELTRRAGGLAEKVLKQPLRAFDLYDKTFKQTNRSELLPTLRRLGNLIEQEQPERVAKMRERVVEGLRSRIEMSWDAPDQLESLAVIAAVAGEDRRDLDAERRIAEEALAIVRRENEGQSIAAALFRALAGRLSSAGRAEDAATWRAHADELDPPHTDSANGAAGAQRAPSDVAPDERADAPGEAGVEHGAKATFRRTSAAPEAPEGWTHAPERAATAAASETELGVATRAERDTTSWTLTELEALPQDAAGADGAHAIAAWFRSGSVEQAIGPAPEPGVVDAVRRGPHELEFGVLSAVWHCALPIFRKTLRQYGAADGRRVSGIGNRPLALAVREALARTRSHDVAVYACDPAAGTISVAPTHPPSVLVRTLDDSPARLVFRLARAMHLARPENILLSSRSADDGRMLMQAIQGAFGPHDPGRSIDPDTATLAADLWHTIASRDQADIRHALQGQGLDFDELSVITQSRAALVGLACCGHVSAAVAGLFADDPTLADLADTPAEERFALALQRSPGFRAIVEHALRDG